MKDTTDHHGTGSGASVGTPPPVVGFTRALEAALDRLVDVQPVFMRTAEKQEALLGLRRAQDRLAGLAMKVLAAADDVAEETAARDQAAWLAHASRTRRGPQAADLELGRALERRWTRLGRALDEGRVNLAQTRVFSESWDLPVTRSNV